MHVSANLSTHTHVRFQFTQSLYTTNVQYFIFEIECVVSDPCNNQK